MIDQMDSIEQEKNKIIEKLHGIDHDALCQQKTFPNTHIYARDEFIDRMKSLIKNGDGSQAVYFFLRGKQKFDYLTSLGVDEKNIAKYSHKYDHSLPHCGNHPKCSEYVDHHGCRRQLARCQCSHQLLIQPYSHQLYLPLSAQLQWLTHSQGIFVINKFDE